MTEDKWIIKTIRKRNEQGLEELIHKYGGLIKSIIQKQLYALSGHQDECLNDVFQAVWNNIEQYDATKSNFKNWLAVIAKYRSIYIKKNTERIKDRWLGRSSGNGICTYRQAFISRIMGNSPGRIACAT